MRPRVDSRLNLLFRFLNEFQSQEEISVISPGTFFGKRRSENKSLEAPLKDHGK